MEIESIFINAYITILSLAILILSYASYRKYKNLKLIFVTFAFFIFLIKGIVLSLSLFLEELSGISASPYFALFDVIILTLLFISTLKR